MVQAILSSNRFTRQSDCQTKGSSGPYIHHAYLDGILVPIFRHLFRHEERFEFAIQISLSESSKAIGQEVDGLWLVLGHVLAQVDETHGRALFLLQAEELENSVVLGVVNVHKDEQYFACEGGG